MSSDDATNGLIRWLEGRLGRPLVKWERAELMQWLRRIWLDDQQ